MQLLSLSKFRLRKLKKLGSRAPICIDIDPVERQHAYLYRAPNLFIRLDALQPDLWRLFADHGAILNENGQRCDLPVLSGQNRLVNAASVVVLAERVEDGKVLLSWKPVYDYLKILLTRNVIVEIEVGKKLGYFVNHD